MVVERVSQPWIETPCRRSAILSRAAGCNIFLKLENNQPSGSFKSRGIGNLMAHAIAASPEPSRVHFYCSSGGNAGLACATAAITLQRPTTIVVPLVTSQAMITRLRDLGAEVLQNGKAWRFADEYLRAELLAKDEHGVYVPPFDDPLIWRGHASIVTEIEGQMADVGGYDALVCSVGGGGLLNGLMEGLEGHRRLLCSPKVFNKYMTRSPYVKVLAVETEGADSLAYSVALGEHVRLPGGIRSIATTLGCDFVSKKTYTWAQREDVVTCVLSDAEAAMACVRFADDEKMLVEPACGVSLATAYNGMIKELLFFAVGKEEFARKNVVIVVCGGSGVTLEDLAGFTDTYGRDEKVERWFGARSMMKADTVNVNRLETRIPLGERVLKGKGN